VNFLRVAATLAALFCFLASEAWGAEKFTYSGGKWKKSTKEEQTKSAEEAVQERDKEAKKQRTLTISIPEEEFRPQKVRKEP
jgi:hypothetical protein